jgi:hypothetical protein
MRQEASFSKHIFDELVEDGELVEGTAAYVRAQTLLRHGKTELGASEDDELLRVVGNYHVRQARTPR